MRQSGWTLKQLLVVLAIIALLAALLFPVVQIARYRLLEARCRANLWAIYTKYRLIKIAEGLFPYDEIRSLLAGATLRLQVQLALLVGGFVSEFSFESYGSGLQDGLK